MTRLIVRFLPCVLSILFVCGIPTQAMAGNPTPTIAGPHGENGKISQLNGEYYISYVYIESPGKPGQPVMFKVFKPLLDPPSGLPKPRPLVGDVGSWGFIGDGPMANIAALMDLDANGTVTFRMMPPDTVARYRPAAVAAPAGQAASAGPATSTFPDPNFPKPQERVELGPNDFDALSLAYGYESGTERPSQVVVYFKSGFGARMTYLGYNDQGTWLTDNPLDDKRLYTYKNGAHIPIPDSIACNHGLGNCVATGVLTRQPHSTALPNNLRNRPVPQAASNGGPPGWKPRDPNFPKQSDGFNLAMNDFGARSMNYNYFGDGDRPSSIEVQFARYGELLTYLGFNDEGAWLRGGQNDPKRLFTFKGDVRIPIPESMDCQNGGGICWAGGVLTRKPYSTPLPKNLHNSPDGNRAASSGEFGNGPTAEEESAQNDREQQLMTADRQVFDLEKQVLQGIWQPNYADANKKLADQKLADNDYRAWRVQREKDCGLTPSNRPVALNAWSIGIAQNVATYNCMMTKTRERIALYQKALTELTAKKVSTETWTALGVK